MSIDDFGFPDEGNNPLIPPAFDVAATIITVGGVIVVLGIVATIVLAIYRAKRMSDRGQNPLTLQEDLAYRAMQSQTFAPPTTLEQRLAELDDLHRRGVICDDEHRTARAEALRA